MLTLPTTQRGASLIELVIGLAIVAVLMAAGAPQFNTWTQNSKIRSTSESLQNGLQLARAEAVRRNGLVSFDLTNNLNASCAQSLGGTDWVVRIGSGALFPSLCNAAPSDAVSPFLIQTSAASSSTNVVVAASQFNYTFNGLGRITPALAANATIDVSNATGTCATGGGSMACLQLVISPAGLVRMCNPALNAPNPQACNF